MLWEHEPQASVSTAFSSSPKTFTSVSIPVALAGYGSIAHEAKPNGLLTRGP